MNRLRRTDCAGAAGESPAATRASGPGWGRREFAAGVAGASLAFLGVSRRATAGGGNLSDPDAVKAYLRQIKSLVCSVSDFVQGQAGPLENQEDRDFVAATIMDAAILGQQLLNKRASLLFSPPSSWLFWTPIDLTGADLTETAAIGCMEACEALETYCAALPEGHSPEAAEALWRLQGTYCHLFATAGIEGGEG